MSDDAKDELKALVVQARQEKHGRLPETLRQRLMRYAIGRWKSGASTRTLAAELGVSGHTLRYWKAQRMGPGRTKLKPVRVIEESSSGHAVSGPCGTRIESLSLDEIAELFRKLS
jgi:hypothetical protein